MKTEILVLGEGTDSDSGEYLATNLRVPSVVQEPLTTVLTKRCMANRCGIYPSCGPQIREALNLLFIRPTGTNRIPSTCIQNGAEIKVTYEEPQIEITFQGEKEFYPPKKVPETQLPSHRFSIELIETGPQSEEEVYSGN